MSREASISGIGSYHPKNLIENSYFNKRYGEDVDTWLKTNLNIHQRYYSDEDECSSDMAVQASKKALAKANLKASDIDLIIVSTDTPDYISPNTASVVHYKLQTLNASAIDINTACSGFPTALDMAGKYIKSDENYTHVLVIAVYNMSKFLNMDDKKTATLFADGAGAVILSASEKVGYLGAELKTLSDYVNVMGIYGGAASAPSTVESIQENKQKLVFNERMDPSINPTHWPKMIHKLLKKINKKISDIDHIIFTQLNQRAIDETMNSLKLDLSKAHKIIQDVGYTGSASIPMAFVSAVEKNLIKKGDFVLFVGSGGGLTMAATAIIY